MVDTFSRVMGSATYDGVPAECVGNSVKILALHSFELCGVSFPNALSPYPRKSLTERRLAL